MIDIIFVGIGGAIGLGAFVIGLIVLDAISNWIDGYRERKENKKHGWYDNK